VSNHTTVVEIGGNYPKAISQNECIRDPSTTPHCFTLTFLHG